MVLVPLKFSFFDDESLDPMEIAKWPIDIDVDDGVDTKSHAAQTFGRQTNHLIDPFSPSPHSKSYFVDIHAQENIRFSSVTVSTTRPLESTVRSHPSVKSSISHNRPRSPSSLSFFSPTYAHPSLLFNLTKPQPPEVSFLDLPESKPEKPRRSSSFRLFVSPSLPYSTSSPIPIANLRRHKPSHFRLKSFRRVHRHCWAVTWLNSLFSPHKVSPPKPERRVYRHDTSNTKVVHNTPNLNDVIPDVIPSSFANPLIQSINQTTGEDQKLRYDHENCDVRSRGVQKKEVRTKVSEWFGSSIVTSQPPPEVTPQVMEAMRLFETELANDIVSLVDWRDFCMELLDGKCDE